jgi:iron complex outermembrane receptor protein
MRGFLLSAALAALFPGNVQGTVPEGIVDKLDSAVVSTSRAGESTPVTYSMVQREQLQKTSPSSSLPMALAIQPSVVAVNEGGTGLGYSKMTVRGVKGSQINVTLNGITLNDAESQEVFWVNIPALSSLLSSVQVQRGLGTSASGAGAFGASINMSTASVSQDAYASVDVGYGSYNTFTATAAAGTGKGRKGFYFDFACSKGFTDGYIRNAYADVASAYAALGWMDEKNSLRLMWLYGDQHTGITWNGIDLQQYEKDRRYNPAGEYHDALGNVRYYDNETDNYTQHHLQLNYTRMLGERLLWTSTFHWTNGDGYYENYRPAGMSGYYGFTKDFTGDFIIREALVNNYFVLNSDIRYRSDVLNLTSGFTLSDYDGDHIGQVRWSDFLGDDYDYSSHSWYLNNGRKKEANVFVRAEYEPLDWLTAYADLQYRGVWLRMEGPEDDNVPLDYSTDWQFFNPRAGMSFRWSERHRAFLSAAVGHREPGRADIKENIKNAWLTDVPDVALKPEKMLDVEFGYSFQSEKVGASVNVYLMEYWDMLLETGKLSNVGYAIKENVDRGWRRGLELCASYEPLKWFRADANITLSSNKIRDYKEYVQNVDTYDNWAMTGRTTMYEYGNSTMLMSPSVTGMMKLTFIPWKKAAVSIDGKYVGMQYLDNTMTLSRSIPSYFVSNLSVSHTFDLNRGSLGLALYVNNLFNNMYYADGWCWKNIIEEDGALVDGIGIYPQAPVNYMLKASYRF